MKLRYTRQALADLREAGEYIAADNPSAARGVLARIRAAIEGLRRFPEQGRPGRVEGTRELVIAGTPFIAAYRLERGAIVIAAVIHGARKWPSSFAGQ